MITDFETYVNEGKIGKGVFMILLSLLPFVKSFGQYEFINKDGEKDTLWDPNLSGQEILAIKSGMPDTLTQDVKKKMLDISKEMVIRLNTLSEVTKDRRFKELAKRIEFEMQWTEPPGPHFKFELRDVIIQSVKLFHEYNKFPHRLNIKSIKELHKENMEIFNKISYWYESLSDFDDYSSYPSLNIPSNIYKIPYSDFIIYYNKLLNNYSKISQIENEHKTNYNLVISSIEQILLGLNILVCALLIIYLIRLLLITEARKRNKNIRLATGEIKKVSKETLKKADPYGEEDWTEDGNIEIVDEI